LIAELRGVCWNLSVSVHIGKDSFPLDKVQVILFSVDLCVAPGILILFFVDALVHFDDAFLRALNGPHEITLQI